MTDNIGWIQHFGWKWIILGCYIVFIATLLACDYTYGKKPPKPSKVIPGSIVINNLFKTLQIQTGVDTGDFFEEWNKTHSSFSHKKMKSFFLL